MCVLFVCVFLLIHIYIFVYKYQLFAYIWDASTLFSEPIPKVLIRLNAEDGVAEVTFFRFQKFPGLNVMMLTSEMWWLQYDLCTYMCSYICICVYIHKMIWTQARFVAYGCESSWSHYNQPCLWSPLIFPPAHQILSLPGLCRWFVTSNSWKSQTY